MLSGGFWGVSRYVGEIDAIKCSTFEGSFDEKISSIWGVFTHVACKKFIFMCSGYTVAPSQYF